MSDFQACIYIVIAWFFGLGTGILSTLFLSRLNKEAREYMEEL